MQTCFSCFFHYPGGETSPRPPATGHSRERLSWLCHQPRRSEEKITTSSNFSRGWPGMAWTLLGDAHTRVSSNALTGQPWCLSFSVGGTFAARAVPIYGRNENQPAPMASPAGLQKHSIGALYLLSHQPCSRLVVRPPADMQKRRYAWATANNSRRTLRDMATTAGLIAEEEPRGLPGFGQGGGDLLVHDIHPGQAIVADVCVVSEHIDALAETASCRAGHAAKLAENRKRQKYGPACQQLGLGFLPLAIESDGTFGKGLQDFIARCNSTAHGTSIAGTTWAASSFSSYWRQRISVCHRTVREIRKFTDT